MVTPVTIEVCVARVTDAITAADAGADRLELNSALELHGLTPSLGLCGEVVRAVRVPIIAMLRPHADGFVYDQADRKVILYDAERMLQSGVSGIAFGALREDGLLDVALVREIRRLCANREVVMHRAFDCLENQFDALETLIDLGVDRVLTSGGRGSAMEGLMRLKAMRIAAASRIEILPGGGVSRHNALQIATQAGCWQVHGSFKRIGLERNAPDPEAIRETKRQLLDMAMVSGEVMNKQDSGQFRPPA